MTAPTLKNLLGYAVLWALNTVVGWLALQIAAGSVWGFQAGQVFADHAAGVAGVLTLIAGGLAFWLAANRPRLGREDISNLVNQIGAIDARAVLHGWLDGKGEPLPPLTDEEIDRLARRLCELIAERLESERVERIRKRFPRALEPQATEGKVYG